MLNVSITSALRKIYFVNHKIENEVSTADSCILPQVFDVCKRVCLINGQGEQESCHFLACVAGGMASAK